jgi:hypothetical protein
MLHKERDPCFVKREIPSCDKAHKIVFPETYLVPDHIFILTKHLSKIGLVFDSCAIDAI